MGVPSFYKWLVSKYPNAVVTCKEEEEPIEYNQENPNGVFDNFYLDMNAIIHPCFHPEEQVCPPSTFDEVFEAMFEYIDHLFRIVRPRKLLYMAVDGVTPRAKMNQQRSRRFKAAKDAKDAEVEEKLLRDKFRAEGKEVLPRETHEVSDSNVITPGTVFMDRLSKALEYYVRVRLNSAPGWKDIKVILSDANVPGEGEHKIMSFIHAQRSRESYDANTRHCLYGLDADLIMLALATHEVHFSVLREDMLNPNMQENCIPLSEKCFTTEEFARVKSRGWFPRVTGAKQKCRLPKKPYQFLNIWTLRDYLELEMKISIPNFKTDIERIIDDFVFICFLTGNDFLPRIPSLEIHEFAVDLLIEVYKTTFNKMGGYIIDTDKLKDKHAAYLKVSRLERFLHEVALYEEKIFLKRYELREKLQRKILRQALENEWSENNFDDTEDSTESSDTMEKSFWKQCSVSTSSSTTSGSADNSDVRKNTMELRQALKDAIGNKQDLFKSGAFKHDRVRLGFPGWKSRYYHEKFGAETSHEVTCLQNDMVQKYLEGLCWVLQYYYVGVPSWSWYYPFYYAPFASDFKALSRFKISFDIGEPLKPFDQLMAVLPPESSSALPKAYNKLMSCEESAILKFYPSDFETDTDGKRFLWQGIVRLPFIDEELLLLTTKTVEKDLEMHEVKRNTMRQEKIFLSYSSALANHAPFASTSDCSLTKYPIDSASDIGGWLSPDDDGQSSGFFRSPIKNMEDVKYDQAVSAIFFNPESTKNTPRLLKNVTIPEKTVTEADIARRQLWHEYRGPNRNQSCRITPICKPEEFKNAGTGWRGRGRGTDIGETRRTGDGQGQCGRYQDRSYGRGHGYNFRTRDGAANGAFHRQKTEWRPVGSQPTGGGNGRGRGGRGQYRAW